MIQNILKTDAQIMQQLAPNAKPVYYSKSPSKLIRLARMDNGMWITIETKLSNGDYFNLLQNYCKEWNQCAQVLNKQVDKQGRIIHLFKIINA